jgi:hypothetical protein
MSYKSNTQVQKLGGVTAKSSERLDIKEAVKYTNIASVFKVGNHRIPNFKNVENFDLIV